MKPKISLFLHNPECSQDCCDGIINSLSSDYDISLFSEEDIDRDNFFDGVDIIAFPGGIGDSDSNYKFFTRRRANKIAKFVENGGKYLGICMGAYWAGRRYFNILQHADAVQYIRRPRTDTRRPHPKAMPIIWHGSEEKMYFYDGCAITGDATQFETIATYANGDPMAIIQNRIGLIGCHPESEEFWYDRPRWMRGHYHNGRHHQLLRDFVDKLMQK